jgi:hypothetical protein
MKISKENYEAIAIDYLDGSLDKQSREAFEAFLHQHPDIAEEVSLLSDVPFDLKEELQAEQVPKELLLKDSTLVAEDGADVLDDICIDIIEGNYNEEDANRIEKRLLAKERSRKRLMTYRNTIAVPDYSLAFPDKSRLFHQSRLGRFQKKTLRYALLGAAASVVIMLGIQQLSQHDEILPVTGSHIVADATTKSDNKEISKETSTEVGENEENSASLKKGNAAKSSEESNKGKKVEQSAPRKSTTNNSRPVIKIRTQDPVMLAKAPKIQVDIDHDKAQLPRLASVPRVERTVVEPTLSTDIGLTEALAVNINKYVFQKDPQSPEAKRLSVWDVAHLGVNGVNKLTGTNMELERKYDDHGKMVELAFHSKVFSYEKKKSN